MVTKQNSQTALISVQRSSVTSQDALHQTLYNYTCINRLYNKT